jgi:hypothetical protein
MTIENKIVDKLTSKVQRSNVKLPKIKKPHKITDDNQSINNGVINEKYPVCLRSPTKG